MYLKKRLSVLDFWRFVAACKIMVFHLYRFPDFLSGGVAYEFNSWIYVEFFFIVTGYLTCKHFIKSQSENIFESGFNYMVKKFTPFLPYVIGVTFIHYIYFGILNSNGNISEFVLYFTDFPFESLLIGEIMGGKAALGQMWFLSSMFLTFPVLLIISQLKNKYLVLFISGWFALFTYGLGIERSLKGDLTRALAGMLLGVFLCELTEILKEKHPVEPSRSTRITLTATEVFCLCLAACLTCNWYYDVRKIILLLFAVGIGIMISGYSYTAKIHSKFLTFLGKMSMPMYIWHWTVFSIIGECRHSLGDVWFIVLYFAVTMTLSILSYFIVEFTKSYLKKRKLKNQTV